MLEEGKEVTILDVRPQEQREEWMIAGSRHVDAYQRLNEGDNSVLDKIDLPDGKMVVTVCAAGRTSRIASEALREKGVNAHSLEGGMRAWNYAWNTAEIKDDEVTIIQVRRVAKGCLSYIIGSEDEAVVVDASLDPRVYVELSNKYHWKIRYVMDTHIHADYVSRTIELAKETGAMHLFNETAEVEYNYTPLSDGETVRFGSASLSAVFTPGHTPESTSYLINSNYLLTGDTLFTDGIGRPDLKADLPKSLEKAAQLYISIGKILALSREDLLILPAHTSQSISFDKKIISARLSNLTDKIELLSLEEKEFTRQIMQRIPPTPPNYLQIAAINKSGNHEGISLADLEAGANRCAVS